MSEVRSTDRDPTPELPRLPAPAAVMRGLRRRFVPASDASPTAARAHGPLAAASPDPGDRTANSPSRRPR
jgi:hypothetical protein